MRFLLHASYVLLLLVDKSYATACLGLDLSTDFTMLCFNCAGAMLAAAKANQWKRCVRVHPPLLAPSSSLLARRGLNMDLQP